MSSRTTLRTFSNKQTTNTTNDDKINRNIFNFKMDFLVGRATSKDDKEHKSSYFSRAALQVKNPDLTYDLLKKVDKRKENIHLKTEFSTGNNNHLKEEKKKELVALLNGNSFSNGKHSKAGTSSSQNKILRSLEVMKLKLESNNHPANR